MTTAGYSALQEELTHRIQVERVRLIERVKQTVADDTNLEENAEYYAAKADQELNEARIVELEDKLVRAEVIDVSKLSGETVKFGATVTLIDEDSDEAKVWQIVGEPEANPREQKISVVSPIARALIGKRKGAVVEVQAPGGPKEYHVQKVEWLADGPPAKQTA